MGDAASAILELILLAPFSIPHAVLEGGPAPPYGWTFVGAPYADGASGYLEPVHEGPDATVEPRAGRPFAGQITMDGLSADGGDFGRIRAGGRFLTRFRLELDAAYAYYVDAATFGRSTASGTSSRLGPSAWMGTTHVAYRFAQSERIQFRAGLGLRHRIHGPTQEFGVDAAYGVNVFWGAHLTSAVDASGGSIGTKGWAADASATVGYVVDRWELFLGYEATWIGAPRTHTEFLGGPMLGVRTYL